MSNLFDLKDRVALVSGAASGLGKAMSLALAEHGADLLLVDRNADGLTDTASRIRTICDVSDPQQIRELFAQLDREFGRIDMLGNVAGDGIMKSPLEFSVDEVTRVLQNLVVGRFVMCQEGGKRMIAAGRGSIINIGSLASITALGRGHIAYSMAMGAVAQMTRELSTEWAGKGVRVNAILPAQVVNPGLQERMNADPNLKTKFGSSR
jgi:NAD(P)-dependent dehydrogenase (short-subunit alcohol dehydrogenase family)